MTKEGPGRFIVEIRDDWRDHAACRDTDPDLFFPVGETGPALEQIENAKRICAECEVGRACLEYALVTKQDWGIWGGTTEEERRAMRRQRVTRDLPSAQ